MFSDILAKLMKERNITQKQLVSDLEIGKNQVAYWKKNDAVPNKTTLKAIAAYFDVSVDYLLGKEPTDSGVREGAQESSLSPDEQQLLDKYRQLNQQGKEYILQTIDMACSVYTKNNEISNVENAG